MTKKVLLAAVQAAAKENAAQVSDYLVRLQAEHAPKGRKPLSYLSGRSTEDVANRCGRWTVMKHIFDAIASEEGGYICTLEGIAGYTYAYVSVHQLPSEDLSTPLAEMYDKSVFTSLPTLEVEGQRILLLHQDSQKAHSLRGIQVGECREMPYLQWTPKKEPDENYQLSLVRIF